MKKELAIASIVLVTASSALSAIKQSDVARLDKDKDGKVSQAEFVASFAGGFDRKDKNKDGFLSLEEHGPKKFTWLDKNKDGKLTLEEYSFLYKKQFDNVHDKNKDGFVAGAEIK